MKNFKYFYNKTLHDADITTVMVTGDNILTAISVGRDCELIKPDQVLDKPALVILSSSHQLVRLKIAPISVNVFNVTDFLFQWPVL